MQHYTIVFRPIVERTSEILRLSVVLADKGYSSEDNHTFVRESLHPFSIIPSRYVNVPIWRTHGKYRREVKRGYFEILYHQRNKDETIISVIKWWCLANRLYRDYQEHRIESYHSSVLLTRCIG